MKITINEAHIKRHFDELSKRSVVVGILDTKKSAKPDYSRGATSLYGANKKNYVAKGSRAKNPELRQLMSWLEKGRGVLSKPVHDSRNRDLLKVTALLLQETITPDQIKRIENASIALIRNGILRKDYGKNATSTIRSKGFDMYGVQTGTLFKNIKARYSGDAAFDL